ncbi:discoidin domain-containing protein [Romboutsia sp.]|uniref:discoidin domain-containing protein n=1 Tax=Romboutsia sp. TaxID=1965302 RepID=UPI002B594855|nr:discoidin domain-containing protein [Romboutsia sp.]HSQ89341.1 discoidin domain-containing protein [Romboutsia sp.]
MKKRVVFITFTLMIMIMALSATSFAENEQVQESSALGTYGSENIALGKTVIPITNTVLGNSSAIVDGNHRNYWYSYQGSPSYQEFILDLGEVYKLGKIDIVALQTYGCTVSTSVDKVSWDEAFKGDWSSFSAPIDIALDGSKEARYIKYKSYANWPQYVGVSEIEVYEWIDTTSSSSQIGTTNIALNKNCENISLNDLKSVVSGYSQANAVDGDYTTATLPSLSSTVDVYGGKQFWSRGYVRVDLGQVYNLGKIVLKPKDAHWIMAEMSETIGILPNGMTSQVLDPWVSKTYMDKLGTNSSSSEPVVFTFNKPISTRYIWVMAGTDGSTTTLSPGIAEIEAYEWIDETTENDTKAPSSVINTNTTSNLWTNRDVTATINAVDDQEGVGVKEIHYSINGGSEKIVEGDNTSFTISNEGISTISYYSVDNAGNVEETKTTQVKIDKTAPSLSFSGNLETYSTDMNVEIACNIEDSLSGIATSCENISVSASSLPLGINTISRTVTDNAGNTTTKTVSFKVVPAVDSWTELRELVQKYCTKNGIINSLNAKIDAAKKAYERGNNTTKINILGAFINEVKAQSDKSIESEFANLLINKVKKLQANE